MWEHSHQPKNMMTSHDTEVQEIEVKSVRSKPHIITTERPSSHTLAGEELTPSKHIATMTQQKERTFLSIWVWEILSFVMMIIALAGIVAVLVVCNGQP
jgi:hypothetical protein